MALNSSGPISLAGATTGQSIAVELSVGTTTQISLNCTNVRTLAGVPTGAIVMPTNFWGKSALAFGCATYTTVGTFSFVVPTGATKICVVCVAGGANALPPGCSCGYGIGGCGGGLSYTNCITTTPGETLTVVVPSAGGTSSIKRGATVLVSAVLGVNTASTAAVKYAGGNGSLSCPSTGGGGAAGYAGNGGYYTTNPTVGGGGGGQGGFNCGCAYSGSGGGGGVGVVSPGLGTTGTPAANYLLVATGGSGGANGGPGNNTSAPGPGGNGGLYGGGGGA